MPDSTTTVDADISSWTPSTRLLFRFAFCYFLMYAFCCGNATVWEMFPVIGGTLEAWAAKPFWRPAQWLGQHLFHLQGISAILHPSGSGDRPLDWIAIGIMLSVACVAAGLWTAFDRERLEYRTLLRWFHFTLRLTLCYAMLFYGIPKVLPMQMPPPSLAVLNEPFGNTSPMTLLWTFVGSNPVYETICGIVEVTGGLLLLVRRTALLGALLTAVSMANVVLYNFCFDVPVKLYAVHLLLMAMVLLAPDLGPLLRFLLHLPATVRVAGEGPFTRLGRRIEAICIVAILFLGAGVMTFNYGKTYAQEQSNLRHPSPLTGQWHIDSATLSMNGTRTSQPCVTPEGLPITDVFFEPNGPVHLRAQDNVLWRVKAEYDTAHQTLSLRSNVPITGTYAVSQPDAMHLVLSNVAANGYTLRLTRVPLPQHYPLLERGFHLVSEWPLER